MCERLVWSFEAITSINWAEVMAALATVAGAFLAYLALKNWQLQDKAKRQAEFIDSLIETAHAFIAEMRKPITLVEFATFGFKGHEPLEQIGTDEEKATKGAILYIQRNGRDEAKRLLVALETVQISTVALRSLVAKGQVFQFKNYAECQNAVAMLT